MKSLDKKNFEKLANAHDAHCVSIYLPTQRKGQEVLEGQARIQLRNHLKSVREELKQHGLSDQEAGQYLQPVRELAENSGLWRNLAEGMAIFLSPRDFVYFTLPVHLPAYTYIGNHFYLLPLLPFFNGDGRFFLLELNLEDINFFSGSRDQMSELPLKDLAPERLREVVGFDYEQKFLNFRTGQAAAAGSGAIFHGHGEGDDDRKGEIEQFLRAVDRGLMNMLNDEKAPLLLYGVEYVVSLYRDINRYPYLVDEFIAGSPGREDLNSLHAKAWQILQPYFDRPRLEKADQYTELRATGRTSYKLTEILEGAISGRVDTLFLQRGAQVFGIYDPAERALETEEKKTVANASLTNLTAVRTFLQGGKVFLMEPDQMPETDTEINALFRY